MELVGLKPGQHGRVVSIVHESQNGPDTNDMLVRRLMELGFIPGTIVTAMHQAPLARDPISVTVRGMHVALRRNEAKLVHVELVSTLDGGVL